MERKTQPNHEAKATLSGKAYKVELPQRIAKPDIGAASISSSRTIFELHRVPHVETFSSHLGHPMQDREAEIARFRSDLVMTSLIRVTPRESSVIEALFIDGETVREYADRTGTSLRRTNALKKHALEKMMLPLLDNGMLNQNDVSGHDSRDVLRRVETVARDHLRSIDIPEHVDSAIWHESTLYERFVYEKYLELGDVSALSTQYKIDRSTAISIIAKIGNTDDSAGALDTSFTEEVEHTTHDRPFTFVHMIREGELELEDLTSVLGIIDEDENRIRERISQEDTEDINSTTENVSTFEILFSRMLANIVSEEEMSSIMSTLTEKQRRALILKYVAGYSAKDIATVMGVHRTSINGHLSRADDNLKKHL